VDHVSPQQQHDADVAERHALDAVSEGSDHTDTQERDLASEWRVSTLATVGVSAAALLLFAAFLALGVWQVHRLSWKLDLIARVEARVHAAPAPAPTAADLPGVTAERDEYRRVTLSGTFRHDRETLVQAVTDLGPGYWVITPLQRDDGTTVLINRGFVPGDRADPATRASGQIAGETTVTGLLRPSEPGGAFLRRNDPVHDRWFSRDVAAIAASHGVAPVAPFFVDADATPNPGGYPVGGLTVVSFRNAHLVYALTWFVLALMVAAGWGRYIWEERRNARRSRTRAPSPFRSIDPARSFGQREPEIRA
jgi:surfeit locus 1 family protein